MMLPPAPNKLKAREYILRSCLSITFLIFFRQFLSLYYCEIKFVLKKCLIYQSLRAYRHKRKKLNARKSFRIQFSDLLLKWGFYSDWNLYGIKEITNSRWVGIIAHWEFENQLILSSNTEHSLDQFLPRNENIYISKT